MKRTFIAIIALLVIAITSSAQRQIEPHFYLGGKGGMTISRTNFSPSVPQKMIMGALAGVQVRYSEERHFGIVGELNFEQRGWSESFPETNLKYNRTLNYLQLPVLAHIFFGSDKCRFFINLGPEIGVMIAENTSANFDISNPTREPGFPEWHKHEQYTMPVKNKFDYGISAGLGVELWVKPKHSIFLEGRFYYGLNNIYPAHKKDVFASSQAMSIMVNLGYYFKLK